MVLLKKFMNDAARPSSRMMSRIKSSLVNPRPTPNSQPQTQPDPTQVIQASEPSTPPSPPPQPQQAPQQGSVLSDSQKLALFEQIIDQVEQQSPAPTAPTEATTAPAAPVPPPSINVGSKEAVELSSSPDQAPIDAGAAIQYVEKEKNPEIPVEVEGFLQSVEDMAEEQPPEVFIADGTTEQETANYPSRPVVVLPISQKIEAKGAKKSPKLSIRWLVEWSRKIMKIFAGQVIYKEDQPSSA